MRTFSFLLAAAGRARLVGRNGEMRQPEQDPLPHPSAKEEAPPTGPDWLRDRYCIDPDEAPLWVRDRLVLLGPDAATVRYLARAKREKLGWLRTFAQRALSRLVLSHYDANALLRAYPMHLLGTHQWRRLLGSARGTRLLDVGAGTGDITAQLAPLFCEVHTTETSRLMAQALRKRGFPCYELDLAEGVPLATYEAVACLNVLDRCRRPAQLLANLERTLEPDGLLILSVPLPYSPVVFVGPYALDPDELLPIEAQTWMAGAVQLVEYVQHATSLVLRSLTRVPYLTGADGKCDLHVLDAALAVFAAPRP